MSAAAAEPFRDARRRRQADEFGMFVFLASEVMLFGGLFAALSYDRVRHPGAAARVAEHLSLWLGTANTAVLLTSSLVVALATLAARDGHRRWTTAGLVAAAALGLAFIVIKGFEYRVDDAQGLTPRGGPALAGHPPTSLFIALYYISTIAHAVHVTVGVTLLAGTATAVGRGRIGVPARAMTIHLVGLYWHLVDIIWLFLFPMLYLARP